LIAHTTAGYWIARYLSITAISDMRFPPASISPAICQRLLCFACAIYRAFIFLLLHFLRISALHVAPASFTHCRSQEAALLSRLPHILQASLLFSLGFTEVEPSLSLLLSLFSILIFIFFDFLHFLIIFISRVISLSLHARAEIEHTSLSSASASLQLLYLQPATLLWACRVILQEWFSIASRDFSSFENRQLVQKCFSSDLAAVEWSWNSSIFSHAFSYI